MVWTEHIIKVIIYKVILTNYWLPKQLESRCFIFCTARERFRTLNVALKRSTHTHTHEGKKLSRYVRMDRLRI